VAWIRDDFVHHHCRRAEWNFDGIRHAGAPGIHGRNDKPGRFAKRDITQQLDREWSARHRPVRGRLANRRRRRGDVFFLNGLSFIAVIAGLMMMRLPRFERKIEIVSAGEHAWEGISYSIKHPRVRTILLLFLAVGVFGWSYAVLMPAFARDVLGRGANGYGILMSASGTGAFVGALLVATFGHLFTPRKIALGGVWLFSIAILAVSFTKSFPLALVFLFAAGFGMLLFFSTSNTVLQTIVPDEMRGRVMGVWSLVFGAMIPLGSLEAGAVAHWVGTPLALAFGAIICAASALVTLFVIWRREAQNAK
jgi:predicted MFS family arabinose efflux permease